jgi:nitrous oxide reductase accessory protein NosL
LAQRHAGAFLVVVAQRIGGVLAAEAQPFVGVDDAERGGHARRCDELAQRHGYPLAEFVVTAHRRNPLRLMTITPLGARRSSTR